MVMSNVLRLSAMYTNLNLCAIALCWWFSVELLKDILRASTLLIAVAVASIWIMGDIRTTYVELVDSFAPMNTLSQLQKQGIAFIADILFHVGPLLLIGLPHQLLSMIGAYLLFVAWYQVYRDKITQLYAPSVSTTYPILFVTGFVLLYSIIMVLL